LHLLHQILSHNRNRNSNNRHHLQVQVHYSIGRCKFTF
jgi:hypothetical protein